MLFENKKSRPLADALRPATLNEVIGQEHLIGQGKALTSLVNAPKLPSLILWGPPGCGKTTLARLISHSIKLHFAQVSAVLSGVSELRKIFEEAEDRWKWGEGTLLFVDEIHRFNRSQQDIFLAHLEEGTITLIGATTENPSFELNPALLSRCQVLILKRLEENDLERVLQRAEIFLKKKLPLDSSARTTLISMADGDARSLLNMAEILFNEDKVDTDKLSLILNKRAPIYDKAQEGHYNLISALHKAMRASDVNAALYWFARMLQGGENPLYILRRLVRFAAEDIGLADPQALSQAISAQQAYHFLGSPEGELAITQCIIYLATAPKSNAAYQAFKAAQQSATQHGSLMPPLYAVNAPTKLMKEIGYGKGYQYDHDAPEEFSGANYFPEGMSRENYYQPKGKGFEQEILKRLQYWQTLRDQKSKD
ncbi:MAG: replication-associated recombination protein A [Candidatus Paracaedimonas acanthamoebae]|uniref:Replication-associated recombination protein A n=1 Tax=Candidatus Paracaedimonas acanthamoebae TaxID=244581 RepID=A0A8J7TVF7_9PROT|nr:replication-associated recombination protein A [Candidatus Paracaedimonas acanthamoebae]